MPVQDRVQLHAARRPHADALNIDRERLSWLQLWQGSNALYQHLCRLSLATGVVAIASANDITFPVAWLAATAQPLTAAVIDPLTPEENLHDILHRLKPDLLLLKRQDHRLIALAERLAIRWLALDGWQHAQPAADDSAFCADMQAATPFLIGFTSGTTSLPKAFIRSRRSWRCSFENGMAIFRLAEAPSTLYPGPLSHGIGLYCLNETLYAGGCFYSMARWQPQAVLMLLAQQRIERLVVVPTMIAGLAAAAQSDYASLRGLISAGAKLELNHYHLARALFPQAVIQEYYGASELGFVAVSTVDDDNIRASLKSVGPAFPATEITIRNDDGELLPAGQPGTIWLNSEQVIDGYLWGDDGSAFEKQPWGATVGDIGYLDVQQRLHMIGRRGNMILSGGNNIYLSEVESVIKSLPGVTEAAVIAVDDAYLGKKMVAVIEAADDIIGQLPQQSRLLLAKYKRPRHYYQIKRWPLTASGKIKRAELERRIEDGSCTELTELSA
ncbi:class I adenylate-forming enzyme family protein [Erwinia tasmaniensis]|uniref:AMP-dependent synthetase and ligase n=1 Tax=Erwinia tasmaniensis (strain DSM 17950 / CFBP 7177 / CIP 109463 / NCPPB 4357 / Et1/99) TaxID=465817 RepID=B2VD46_ERWT9|nr:AMP-binding protein [Erwinia tasmaniensis]CAO95869.1 AMP-dependent synthetase and ligase [Erwinia tasmaniensis Et1/99]